MHKKVLFQLVFHHVHGLVEILFIDWSVKSYLITLTNGALDIIKFVIYSTKISHVDICKNASDWCARFTKCATYGHKISHLFKMYDKISIVWTLCPLPSIVIYSPGKS